MLKFLTQLTTGPKAYAIAPATSTLPELPSAKEPDVDTSEKQVSDEGESSVTDSVAVVELSKKRRKKAKPTDDSDNTNNSSKEEEEMTEHKQKGHHHYHRKYLCLDSLQVPRVHTAFEFTSCCCDDDVEEIIEAFYEFLLTKKALFPTFIKKVKKIKSPNDGCHLVDVAWVLNVEGIIVPQAADDLIDEIFNKYLEYLDSL